MRLFSALRSGVLLCLVLLGGYASVAAAKPADDELNAEQMFRQATAALKAAPRDPKAYAQRAFAGLMLERYDDVVADATRGLALSPQDSSLLAARAAAYDETGHAALAYADAQKAVEADPNNAFAVLQRGLSGEKLDKPSDVTLADVRKAGELDPTFEHFYTEAVARRGLPGVDASGTKPAADLAPSYPTASRRPAALAGLFSLVVCVGMYFLLDRLWKDERPG